MPKEFTTAATAATEDEQAPIEFTVDGDLMHAYPPEPGQLAVVMASMSGHATVTDKVAGLINFFVGVLDEQSHQTLVRRLMDRTDPFEIGQVEEILEWLIEEWAARPTQPLSVSTPSRPNGGRRSTANARRGESTPSDFVPIASAT